MSSSTSPHIQARAPASAPPDLASELGASAPELRNDAVRVPRRLEIDPENLRNGLGQLVLTLVKLLHELLEKQAIRRMEADVLTEAQVEQLGLTLMRQAEEIERLRDVFGLKDEDLNLDLGPLGKLL